MDAISYLEKQLSKTNLPDFRQGDTVRVHVKIKEGEKYRIQVFEGVVIAIRRNGSHTTFTVRKISFGCGVERIFPLHSNIIETVEVMKSGKVRRAKLYFLRQRRGKAARLKEVRHTETAAAAEPTTTA
jgi:large subunit ribosomal protein L19